MDIAQVVESLSSSTTCCSFRTLSAGGCAVPSPPRASILVSERAGERAARRLTHEVGDDADGDLGGCFSADVQSDWRESFENNASSIPAARNRRKKLDLSGSIIPTQPTSLGNDSIRS